MTWSSPEMVCFIQPNVMYVYNKSYASVMYECTLMIIVMM